MDALMIYFLCVAGFFLLCPVIIIVDYIFRKSMNGRKKKRGAGSQLVDQKGIGNSTEDHCLLIGCLTKRQT